MDRVGRLAQQHQTGHVRLDHQAVAAVQVQHDPLARTGYLFVWLARKAAGEAAGEAVR